MNAPAVIAPDRRPIPGWDGYFADADGFIHSGPKKWNAGQHDGMRLKPIKTGNGYCKVSIFKDGKKRQVSVHRLVALAWHPNPDGLPQINHRNCLKDDNRPSNIEWCTAAANSRHAHANGLVNLRTDAFLASVRRNVLRAHAATRGVPKAEWGKR